MSFVTQENVINQFEKLLKTLLFKIKGIRIEKFPKYYWPLESDKTITAWIPLQETSREKFYIIKGDHLDFDPKGKTCQLQYLQVFIQNEPSANHISLFITQQTSYKRGKLNSIL